MSQGAALSDRGMSDGGVYAQLSGKLGEPKVEKLKAWPTCSDSAAWLHIVIYHIIDILLYWLCHHQNLAHQMWRMWRLDQTLHVAWSSHLLMFWNMWLLKTRFMSFYLIKITQCHYDTDYIGHMVVMQLKMLKNWQVWNYIRTPCGFPVIIGNGWWSYLHWTYLTNDQERW